MKRYCLISFCNIYILPYAKLYINTILNSGAECHLIYWDRDAVNGANDKFEGCVKFCYQNKILSVSSIKDKIKGYIGARRFVLKLLSTNNYDGIIFLQTHTAVACESILKKKYAGKYLVDIRDYTLENWFLYKNLEKKVINNSYATVISSPAYSKFLPKHDYVVAHNFSPFPEEIVEKNKAVNVTKRVDPIQISFVGTIRFIEMDKKILRLFANDNRFKINYFGTGSEVLRDFCRKENITNTEFYGSFSPDMTPLFYQKTDLINNLYGNHTPFLDYALSNKLYHAAQLYIPILVCPDTYMEEVCNRYNMGFVFDVEDPKSKENLYRWYCNLDREILIKGCDTFISSVIEENRSFNQLIAEFVNR